MLPSHTSICNAKPYPHLYPSTTVKPSNIYYTTLYRLCLCQFFLYMYLITTLLSLFYYPLPNWMINPFRLLFVQ